MNTTNSTGLTYEQKALTGLEVGSYTLAISIIIFLSCLERNKKGRRPGVAIPVDLLKDDRFTYIYAAAFGCASSSILQLIVSVDTASLNVSSDVKPWIQIPFWLLLATIVSLKFYPIFTAIGYKHRCAGIVIGIVYCGYLFGALLYQLVEVEIQTKDVSAFIISIPILICYIILLSHFIYRAVYSIRQFARRGQIQNDIHPIKHLIGYERAYVKWILKQNFEGEADKDVDTSVYRKLKTYQTDVKERLKVNTHLRTSPRVISTFVVSGMILMQLGISLCVSYQPLRKGGVEFISKTFENSTALPQIKLLVHVTDVSFYVSFITSTVVMAGYIILIYRNYQRDMRKMYNGDFSFLPRKVRKTDNKSFVAASLRYSGTQIAYMFWCYVILFVSILLLCYMTAYLLILPLMKKVPAEFLSFVKAVIPIFAARYLFDISQTLLVNRYFLQDHTVKKEWADDKQRVLALCNRKMFAVLTYFMFFFHVIIGFFACISRIMYGAAIGILTVARIDRSLLPNGYENLDNGYSTYVGLIMLELYHRNPVLIVFCDELQTMLRKKEINEFVSLETPMEHSGYQRSVSESLRAERSKRIRNRWYKAYTLVNNPCLRERKRNLTDRNLSIENTNMLHESET